MPSENTRLVDIRSITAPRGVKQAPRVAVEFGDGTRATLDTTQPRERAWAEVLQSLHAREKPVYLIRDPETRRIATLLIPLRFRVVGVAETEWGDLQVTCDPSQAIHWLRRRHPEFLELRVLLESALKRKRPVWVIDALDAPEIVDVRAPA